MARPSRSTWAETWIAALLALSFIINTCGAPVPFYCRLNEVQCPSKIKSCVLALGICNGIKDCPDGSDENPALCKKYNCSAQDYELTEALDITVPYFRTSKCPSGNMCTKKYTFEYNPEEEDYQTFFKCTGGPKECADGSDEDPRYCKNLDCTKGEYGYWAATCPSKKYCLYPICDRCGDAGVDRLCDGLKDCPDASDEWPSFCKKNGCSNTADSSFRCKDGGCVQTKQICNGVPDCADGSDESPAYCASYACPWSEGNKCPDRRTCLNPLTVCDGKKNCPDGSDEAPAKCRSYQCPTEQWKCKDGLQCIAPGRNQPFPEVPLCDNVYDCKDKSDESAALCKPIDCGQYGAKCRNGACIRDNQICDGTVDCLDGSDEKRSLCKKHKCVSGFVKCKKGRKCVPGKMCDGRVDCEDKSDERPKTCAKFKCPPDTSKCPNFPYQCVPNALLCDGRQKDCINGGDEDPSFCKAYTCPGVKCGLACKDGAFCNDRIDCPGGTDERPSFCKTYKCPKDTAKCADGKQCVAFFDLCRFDGREGICKDKSESNLSFCSTYDCGASQGTGFFKCTKNSTKCFENTRRCDGKIDCPGNNFDENPRFCKKYKCPEEYVKCPDKRQCIRREKYCDGKPDCKLGADEDKTFCKAYKCPVINGYQFLKCPDGLRCTDPAISC